MGLGEHGMGFRLQGRNIVLGVLRPGSLSVGFLSRVVVRGGVNVLTPEEMGASLPVKRNRTVEFTYRSVNLRVNLRVTRQSQHANLPLA